MDPRTLWERYSAIWSLETEYRMDELERCLADDASYCDPNVLLNGRVELSAYMQGFQQDVPGGCFRIDSVSNHHDRSLSRWTLLDSNGNELQHGASFALHAEDGRLSRITGFFQVPDRTTAQ